jgi:predicted enzyme related to lactoylglutathione lyase
MGERTSYTPGTFSWVDLQTSDQDAAKAFYADLLGWDYEEVPIGDDATYSMAKLQGHSVAAIGPLQGEGMPSHWNCYVTVADADASAARAAELGATLLAEPFDVFDAGRMAAFQDPQGAILSLWQAKESIGAGLVNVPGALAWNDLLSSDPETAAAFYRELFDWQIEEIPESGGQYWSIANDGTLNGGILAMPPGAHPAWNLYFGVADADAAAARAQELGAETVMGPMDVPNGRFVVLRDPQDAVFSVVAGPMDP